MLGERTVIANIDDSPLVRAINSALCEDQIENQAYFAGTKIDYLEAKNPEDFRVKLLKELHQDADNVKTNLVVLSDNRMPNKGDNDRLRSFLKDLKGQLKDKLNFLITIISTDDKKVEYPESKNPENSELNETDINKILWINKDDKTKAELFKFLKYCDQLFKTFKSVEVNDDFFKKIEGPMSKAFDEIACREEAAV